MSWGEKGYNKKIELYFKFSHDLIEMYNEPEESHCIHLLLLYLWSLYLHSHLEKKNHILYCEMCREINNIMKRGRVVQI